MSSVFGQNIRVSIFGQSHSECIGVVLDNLPAGLKLDLDAIRALLKRRSPIGKAYATRRREPDEFQIVSGLFEGATCGAPLCAVIHNQDARPGDYAALAATPRPSHADFGARVKYGGFADYRGGGHFSGRLTAPLVFAGGVLRQYLAARGVRIYARIKSIGGIPDQALDLSRLSESAFENLSGDFPTLGDPAPLQERIESCRAAGNSVGGEVECFVFGLPVGVGAPMFDGLENKLASAVFAVPAVKGIEFGLGFELCAMTGSEANDAFRYEEGRVVTATNCNGGILGGMSTGMPVVFRVAVKPTPSIYQEQDTVNLETHTDTKLTIGGRHDPCIVPRAVVCIESAAALAIADLML